MKIINQYNFLRWHTSETFIPTNYDPAKGYLKDRTRCDYMPLLINGEPLNFYINTLAGLDDIIQFPQTSNVAVISQGNTAANIFIFYLSGVPFLSTEAAVTLSIDGGSSFTIYNFAIAGDDTLDKLLDRIVFNMAYLSSTNSTTVERYLSNGIKITAPSTISGDVVISNETVGSPVTLKLVDGITGQVVNANIATLLQDTFADADGNDVFTFYSNVSPSNIAPGIYFFRIGNATDNFLDSNYVIVPADDYSNYSCLCKFRSDRYYYGINYQNLADFYQQFRLHLNEIDAQYENDRDVYNEVSTGKQRTYNNYKKKLRTLEAYYFDADAHDAAEIMFDSEVLFINGRQYTPKATYKISTNQQAKLNKGSVDLYDQDFATANRCLTPITAGSGGTCVAVVIPDSILPNGEMGIPYNYQITLTGTAPFQLTDIVKPAWMNIGITGNVIAFTGTPITSGDDIAVSFTVSNCADANSDDFSGTFDISINNVHIGYTNNKPIHYKIAYGSGAPTTTLIEGDYTGTVNVFSGALPFASQNIELFLSAFTFPETHIISASLVVDGVVASPPVLGVGTAYWANISGSDLRFSFITG